MELRDDFAEDIRRLKIGNGTRYTDLRGRHYIVDNLRLDGAMTLRRETPKVKGKAARRAARAAGRRRQGVRTMKLPDSVKATRSRFVAKFGLPVGSPTIIDDIAREWSTKFAQQVAKDHPGAGYGMKRADPGRPVGKDTLARMTSDGLICWDLFTGTGTGSPSLNDDPDSLSIPDQVFVQVTPVDYLGGTSSVPPGPNDPTPLPGQPPLEVQLAALGLAVKALAQQVAGMNGLVSHLEDLLKSGDDNNERRYQDTVNHFEAMGSNGLTGTARIPYLGTAQLDLSPKK